MAATTSSKAGAGPVEDRERADRERRALVHVLGLEEGVRQRGQSLHRDQPPSACGVAARGGRNRAAGPKALWSWPVPGGTVEEEGNDRRRSDDERPGAPAGAAGGPRRAPPTRNSADRARLWAGLNRYLGSRGAARAQRSRRPSERAARRPNGVPRAIHDGRRVRTERAPSMRRPIDPVDTIWLNMDRPNNLMVIESLMTCDGADRPGPVPRGAAHAPARPLPGLRAAPGALPGPAGHAALGGRPGLRPERATSGGFTLPAPGDDSALQDHVNALHQHAAAAGPPAVGDAPDRRVRRGVGRLLPAAPRHGRRHRADPRAAVA